MLFCSPMFFRIHAIKRFSQLDVARGATRFGRLGVDLVALWHWSQRGKGSAEGTQMVGGFLSWGKFRGF